MRSLGPVRLTQPDSITTNNVEMPEGLEDASTPTNGSPTLAISARNLLRARIKRITLSEVGAEVTLMIGP